MQWQQNYAPTHSQTYVAWYYKLLVAEHATLKCWKLFCLKETRKSNSHARSGLWCPIVWWTITNISEEDSTSTLCHNPENSLFNLLCCENLKPHEMVQYHCFITHHAMTWYGRPDVPLHTHFLRSVLRGGEQSASHSKFYIRGKNPWVLNGQ